MTSWPRNKQTKRLSDKGEARTEIKQKNQKKKVRMKRKKKKLSCYFRL
jgi:hypothetical protein